MKGSVLFSWRFAGQRMLGYVTRISVCIGLIALASLANTLQAQVNVTSTGGTMNASYSTLSAAVTAINNGVHTGTITVNVNAGFTETLTARINLTATGTAANPITFQKSGGGANPVLVSYAGTKLPADNERDGMFSLSGSDYVTIDGIDLQEAASNTDATTTMEYGYGLFKASDSDGCQNNTIKNCTITLNRVNNGAWSGNGHNGSIGITVNNCTATVNTAITPTAASGANSNNKFYTNTIQNCNAGISFTGYAAATPFTLGDTGNDVGGTTSGTGNMILNFGGGSGATQPATGIFANNQWAFNCSRNTIDNNNGSGVNHITTMRGIFLNSSSTSASADINFNTVSLKGGGTTTQISAIENVFGSTPAGNTININNNTITNCTNATNTSGLWYGIWNSASPANLNINNNTFTNNTTNTTTGSMYLIYNSGAVGTLVNINNNNLSQAFAGATAYSGTMYNIYNSSGTTSTKVNVNGNTFASYTHATIGTGAIYFIYNTNSSLRLSISNNTWNNLTLNHSGSEYLMYNSSNTQGDTLLVQNNSIATGWTRTAAAGTMYIYYAGSSSLGTNTQIFANNNFSNITATTAGTGTFYGFYNSDGATSPYPKKWVYNNTLNNINYNSSGSFYGFYTSYLGDGSTTSGSNVYNNTVSNITFNGTMYCLYPGSTVSPNYAPNFYNNTVLGISNSAASSTVYGAYVFGGGAGLKFYQNKIANIDRTNAATTATTYGLYVGGGTTSNFYNNLVGNITGANINNATGIYGVYVSSGTTINLDFNSVYLNATSAGANFGTVAVYASTTPTVTLRNNIFINTSTPNGTGQTIAYRRSSTTLTTYGSASNSNLFYAGTPGANNLIFNDGTNSDQTIGAFKTRVSPRDAASISENAPFLSTNGTSSNFLHINPAIATQVESGGFNIAGITDDYDGNVRQGNAGYSGTGSAPDIGADEGNFMGIDLSAPNMSYTPLGGTCTAGDATISGVVITDATGIPLTGNLIPRIYYKKNAGSYVSSAGVYVSGSATNSIWNFTISAAAMGGLAIGDVVSYFLIAQDNAAPTPNIGSNPSGVVATDVNTVTTPPATPNTFAVLPTLSGTKTVGVGGDYATLTAAAAAYNTSCLGGPVVFSLIDGSYPSETFPITFNANFTASAVNTLTIRPAAGVTATISGSSTSSIIRLNGADWITIDGSNAGGTDRSLTLQNISTATSTAVVWFSSLGLNAGATNDAIKNCKVIAGSNVTTSTFGIFVDGSAISTSGSGEDNDNILIQNNLVTTAYFGIYARAASAAGANDGLQIIGNTIGSANSAEYVIFRGIDVAYANNPMILQNTIFNLITSGSINNAGIDLGAGVINGSVSRNYISGVQSLSTSGYGAYGINFSSTTGTTGVVVSNNFISDILGSNYTGSTIYNAFGIRLAGGTNIKLYNNSINMFGTPPNGTSTGTYTANILVTTTSVTGLEIRNNILRNTQSFVNAGSFAYNVYLVSGVTLAGSNNNDYYGLSTANTTYNVGYNGTAQMTLANWQAATGQDGASTTAEPLFTSNTDLHLTTSNNHCLDGNGAPLAAVTNDYDGQARNATMPDIGADEFTNTALTIAVTETSGTTNNDGITCAGDPATITAGGGSSYSWSNGSNNTNPITVNPTTTTTYTVTITNGSCTDLLSATVTVNALPTVYNLTGGGSYCAPGAGVPVGLAGSETGVNYQLQRNGVNTGSPVAGTGSALAFGNQTQAGTYTVFAANPSSNCSGPMGASVSVTANPTPAAFTVTGGGSYCTPGAGVPVGLSGSETGASYQLQIGGTNTGAPVAGTGAAISFGNQTASGNYTVIATANTGGCTANMTGSVTVTANPTPSLTETHVEPTSCSANNGSIDLTVSGATGPFSYNWTTPNGSGLVQGQEDQSNLTVGTYFVTVTATSTGCTAALSLQLGANLGCNTPPSIGCPANVTVSCASNVPAPNINEVTTSATCIGPITVVHVGDVISNQTCTNRFTVTRTYKATDFCGNSATCNQIITVNDQSAPVMNCPAPVTVSCASNVPAVNINGVTATDNCSGAVTITHVGDVTSNQTCANRFTLTRTYRATDVCGNSGTCSQVITVNDQTAPAVTCPANVTVSCAANVPAANTTSVTSSDNCGGTTTVSFVGDVTSNQTCTNRFTVTRTYVAADVCGNSASCAQVITVNDQTPPSLTCPPPLTVSCASQVPVSNTAGVTGVSDNCTGTATVSFVSDVITNQTCTNRYTLNRTYRATDVCGNFSDCVQLITVNDITAPTITCPGPVTVTCASTVPAVNTTSVTTGADNCGGTNTVTFVSDAISNQTCANRYTITRTYRVADACNNSATCTQTIVVNDQTPPTVTCTNISVTLAANGILVVPASSLGTASDNCGTVTYTPATFTFTCADASKTVTRVVAVADACGQTASCTVQITVAPTDRCTPKIIISDPCVCKNNATTLENGQFGETVKVESLTGKTWTVTAVSGLYASSSPNPPTAPFAIAIGTPLTENPVGSGDYFLSGVHIDALGYTLSVTSAQGEVLTISNKCSYPNPSFTSNLDGPYCLYSPSITLAGDPGDANIVSQGFKVNGVNATSFNPANGVGVYTIEYTVDGGVPKAAGANDPGCVQTVSKTVYVVATPSVIFCNDLVQVSLDDDCSTEVTPDMILEGTYGCYDDYSVTITSLNGTQNYGNTVTGANIGQTLKATVKHLVSGNTCWGTIKVEDKLKPELTCKDIHAICAVTNYDADYLKNTLGLADAYPVVKENCSNYTLSYVDNWYDLDCPDAYSARIQRVWTAEDASGNRGTCTQNIYLDRKHVTDVKFPTDVTISCSSSNINTTPSNTGAPYLVAFGKNWALWPNAGNCEMQTAYVDQILPVCEGTYKILRTWTVYDWCLPTSPYPPSTNPQYFIQVIKVLDEDAPALTCPANTTVSTDQNTCCGTPDLPDVIVEDNCSRIKSATARIVVRDPLTNAVLATYDVDGALTDFPGNNHWDLDTLAAFGYGPCLPLGAHTVTYTVEDGCGNTRTCTFRLTIDDQTPPVSACDEFTQVSLGVAGDVYVDATTFDDGSYDNCSKVYFKARRMDNNGCQSNSQFYDQVRFCCDDIGKTLTVVLRVYDVEVAPGTVSTTFEEQNSNDCMVQVFVDDKLKPTCVSPANVTVACENFDPSLWAYGFATANDNCCVDTITVTNSYSLFDTVCNRGTITRTFRSFDCAGLSNQCTQRIIVNYNQNYYIKFPNDVIVTTCDGTGNYGEPTFFGEDCELLGVSHEDEVFTVVPDACYKIERTWTIINWCTYNPNAGCINVPNPNPNATVNHPSNLAGPTVSPAGTLAPWAPTVVKISPTDATSTNYSIFWDANANCYRYKQIIKIIDTQDPVIENCPASPVTLCDLTPNDATLWNQMSWYDQTTGQHDLCEGPSDLNITATDACSGAAINIHYLLFLDLDNDGTMETVINSLNTGIAGLGWNAVPYNNAANPNFSGGQLRPFDQRAVPDNQKYGFAIQTTVSGNKKTAAVRWNTQQAQNTYVVPELPYGTHKIKWIVEDGCGNESVCEYTFVVKDCKAPTVVCLNGLSVNIMPTKMITLWASDFLQYTEDNCTPSNQLKIGIRKSGTGTGFPLNPDGTPQTGVTFDCTELATQLVELWAIDKAGNADFCETYVIVQDNNDFCQGPGAGTVAGVLATEGVKGLEDANVELDGSHPALPPTSLFDLTDNGGKYEFNAVPLLGDYTVTPVKDNDPLNGVSTFDLVLINKHILGLEPLSTPYKMIAADANNSRSITTFDVVELRKLILGIYTELPNNTSWRFVDKSYAFPNPTNPFQAIFPETKQIASLQNNQTDGDFVSVKVGDVNGNAVTSSLTNADDRTSGTLMFDVEDRVVKSGETFTATFRAAEKAAGYQYTLYFPNLEVVDVTPGAEMTLGNFGVFAKDHALTTSYDNEQVSGEFAVTFRALANGTLNQMLTLSSRITKAEGYSLKGERQSVALRFNGASGSTVTGLGFELYQNTPNPWMNRTQVGFYLPAATQATLTIYDETGRTLFTQRGEYGKGYNAIAVERALVNTTGVLYYKLETATDSAVKQMIQTK